MNRKSKNNTKFTWVFNLKYMPTEEMMELIEVLKIEVKKRRERITLFDEF